MKQRTHRRLDPTLAGRADELRQDHARVSLTVREDMVADERGLVHGGFVFGLADTAAMLAVNEPTVVLASAEVKFRRPVMVGDSLVAEARVADRDGIRRVVEVVVRRDYDVVLEGELLCAVPERHVLESS